MATKNTPQQTQLVPIDSIITLSEYQALRKARNRVQWAKELIQDIGQNSYESKVELGFAAGKAFNDLDRAFDVLDDLVYKLEPAEIEEDDIA
jgi:hypothetical protein